MGFVRSALVVVLGVVLSSAPAVAVADVLVRRDPGGDLLRSPVGASAYSPAPTQVQGDILSSRVVHARRAVWIQVRFRELTATTQGNFHLIGIRSDKRSRTVEIDAFPGHWEGTATTRNDRGLVVACATTHRIDYDRNRLMLRVPRTCLGRTHWVRVGIRSTVAGARWVYADDARTRGLLGALAYGPRIRL